MSEFTVIFIYREFGFNIAKDNFGWTFVFKSKW